MINKIKAAFAIAKAWTKAHAPELIFVAGIGLGVATVVEATKAGAENGQKMSNHLDKLEKVNSKLKDAKNNGTKDEIKALQSEKRAEMGATFRDGAKGFAKPIALGAASGAALIGSFFWQSKRYKIAAAAAASTSAILNLVDSNIGKTYGQAAVRAMHDPNWDPAKIREKKEEVDPETGETKVIDAWRSYENVTPSKIHMPGEWIYEYNAQTVDWNFYYEEVINQLLFLQSRQNMLNRRLSTDPSCRGIFVNKVLEEIGLSEEQTPAGQVAGWVKGDYISFGLDDYFAKLGDIGRDGDIVTDINDYLRDGFEIRLNPRGEILDLMYRKAEPHNE